MSSDRDLLTLVIVSDDALVRRGLASLLENPQFLIVDAVPVTGLNPIDEVDVLLWDADPELDSVAIREQASPVLALVEEDAAATLLRGQVRIVSTTLARFRDSHQSRVQTEAPERPGRIG